MIGKTIITENNIVKISLVKDKKLYGYDILSENVICINESEKYIEAPKSILSLLNSEDNRFNYINKVYPKLNVEMKSTLIGISSRTYFRILKNKSNFV